MKSSLVWTPELFLEPLEARIAPASLESVVTVGGAGGVDHNTYYYDDAFVSAGMSAKAISDGDGSIYVTGTFQGTFDFDLTGSVNNLTSAGSQDVFIAKYSASTGALGWVKQWGGTGVQRAVDIIANPDAIHVLVEFDSTPASFGDAPLVTVSAKDAKDIAVLRVTTADGSLDTNFGGTGMVTWGSLGDDEAVALAEDSSGDIFVTGNFKGTGGGFNGGSGLSSSNYDAFLLKISGFDGAPMTSFSGDGQMKWGGTGADKAAALAVDIAGDIFVGGSFNSQNAGFNGSGPLDATGSSRDGFIFKVNGANGSARTAFGTGGQLKFGGTVDDDIRALAIDESGNFFAGGSFGGTDAKLNGSGTVFSSVGSLSAFVLNLNSTTGAAKTGFGTQGLVRFGGTGDAQVLDIKLAFLSVFVAGEFSGTAFDVDGGTSLLNSVNTDGFILRLSDATGIADNTFDSDGVLQLTGSGNDRVNSLALDDVNIIVGLISDSATTGFNGMGDIAPGGFGLPVVARIDGNGLSSLGTTGYFEFAGSKAGSLYAESVLYSNSFITKLRMITDGSGNTYVTGAFSGAVDFDPGAGVAMLSTSSVSDHDAFIVKYDSSNTLVWARSWGGTGEDGAADLKLDGGTLYVAINSASTGAGLGGTGTYSTAGESDAVVLALQTSDGAAASGFGTDGAVGIQGSLSDSAYALEVDGSGNIFVAGFFKSTNLGVGTTGGTAASGSNGDGFLAAMDGAGTAVSGFGTAGLVTFSGLGEDIFTDMAYAGGQVVLVGYTTSASITISDSGTVAVGTGLDRNTIIARVWTDDGAMDTDFGLGDGVVTWGSSTALSASYPYADDIATAVEIDGSGNIFVAGNFFSKNSGFGGAGSLSAISKGLNIGDIFLLKLTTSGAADTSFSGDGQLMWGGDGSEFVSSLRLDGLGNPYVMGQIYGSGLGFNGSGTIEGDEAGFVFSVGGNTGTPNIAFNKTGQASYPESIYNGGHAGGFIADGSVDTAGRFKAIGTFGGTVDFGTGVPLEITSSGETDMFLIRLNPLDEAHAGVPLIFHDADGDTVKITLTGKGFALPSLAGGATDDADLAELKLYGTDASTTLTIEITAATFGATTIGDILTYDASTTDDEFSLKSITFKLGVFLDGTIEIGGALGSLTLPDVSPGSEIHIGADYNLLAPDAEGTDHAKTLKVKTALTLGDVGAGTLVDVHGGLGTISIKTWAGAGTIQTTQDIGNLTVIDGDFGAILLIDANHVGADTIADTGSINVKDGAFTSSGSIVEGTIASFNVAEFEAGASVTASSIGSIAVSSASAAGTGVFAGRITLTATDTKSVLGVFTVSSDFTGIVETSANLKNLVVKGNFTGSIQAKSIGSITAYSFNGATLDEGLDVAYGDTERMNIIATGGNIGVLKSTSGTISNYDIAASGSFGGFTVSLSNLIVDTIGIQNVDVLARTIGNTSVTLKALTKATQTQPIQAVDLVGLQEVLLRTFGFGATSTTNGSIGTVTVTLAGSGLVANGVSAGVVNLTVDSHVTSGEIFGVVPFTIASGDSTLNKGGDIKVTLSNQNSVFVKGMNGLDLDADFAGNLTVTGSSSSGSSSNALIGIESSDIHTWATSAAKGKTGSIGNIAVTLNGAANVASMAGIANLSVDLAGGSVNKLGGLTVTLNKASGTATGILASTLLTDVAGNLTVKITGAAGIEQAIGLDASLVSAMDGALGNVSVTISAPKGSLDMSAGIVGVRDSSVTAGTSIGNVLVDVKATGTDVVGTDEAGDIFALLNTSGAATMTFLNAQSAAGKIGTVTLNAAGSPGFTRVIGTLEDDGIEIQSAGSIGNVTMTVTKGIDVDGSAVGAAVLNNAGLGGGGLGLEAGKSIGNITISGDATTDQAIGLTVVAGQTIGNLTIDAKSKEFADLRNATIQAGTALDLTTVADTLKEEQAAFALAKLGNVTVNGTISSSIIAAVGNIGAVKVETETAGLTLAAGWNFGDYSTVADDVFWKMSSIASVTIGNAATTVALINTHVSAGGSWGADQAWGTDDDAAGGTGAAFVTSGKIGAVKITQVPAPILGSAGLLAYQNSIQAAAIASVNGFKGFADKTLFDLNGGTDDVGDLVARVLV